MGRKVSMTSVVEGLNAEWEKRIIRMTSVVAEVSRGMGEIISCPLMLKFL